MGPKAKSLAGRRPWWFALLLPTVWAAISTLSFRHPGDEYGLWGFSSIAGSWFILVARFLPVSLEGDIRQVFWWVLGAGVVSIGSLGLLLARLRIRYRLFCATWLALAAAMCFGSISSYPSLQRAISKNGSISAYAFSSMNASLTATTLGFALFMPASAWAAWARRPPPGHCACGYDLHGNTSGRCPECGAPRVQPAPESGSG